MPRTVDNDQAVSGTLQRGLTLLEFLAAKGRVTPNELVKELPFTRSTAYRILGMLRERGYVETDDETEAYRLGPRVVELGMAAISEFDPIQESSAYLRELAHLVNETAFLAVVDGDSVVYLGREGDSEGVRMIAKLGRRSPAHATGLGKAYLAALPEEDLEPLLERLDLRRYTPHTITDREALREELTETRARGYAIDHMEYQPGVACFAAAVRDRTGRPQCSISVAGPAERMLQRQSRIAPKVAAVAEAISRRLGYLPLQEREG